MSVSVRPALEADCVRIAEITNEAIATGFAHFSTTPDEAGGVAERWREGHGTYPWFVAEEEGADGARVVGFARASSWDRREAYAWTCMSAVYVENASHGRGVGRMLYDRLFGEIERRGFRCIIAGVALPNPASERLHEAMGMRAVGEFPAVGYKNGAWRDVRYYVKLFGEGEPPGRVPGARV